MTKKYHLRSGELVAQRKHARWELTKKVLLALGMGAIVLSLLITPGSAYALKLFNLDKNAGYTKRQKHRERIRQLLMRLKKKRLVEIYQKGGKEIVEISESGKKRLLKYQLEELKLAKPKKWDGRWRVITFDIPEKHKKARNALREILRKLEFYPLHKSVFISPYPCRDEVDFVSEVFDVGRFVHYFETSFFDDEAELLLQFPDLE